jgi:hypothetical protein
MLVVATQPKKRRREVRDLEDVEHRGTSLLFSTFVSLFSFSTFNDCRVLS